MLNGAFIRSDGLEIPNNITTFGAGKILAAACRGEDFAVWIALVRGTFSLDLTMVGLEEPTFTNGYARAALAQGLTDWPILGEVNGRAFIESKTITFTASGDYSDYVQRLALVDHDTSNVASVFCLSQPLGGDLYIDADTPLFQRRFKYRIYI